MANPLYDALFRPHYGSNLPFLHLPDGRQFSYSDFITLSQRIAQNLCSHGVLPDGRVAVQVHKSVEALAVYAACVQIGAVFLPLNTAYTCAELDYFIEDSEPRVMVCDQSMCASLQTIATANGVTLLTLNADGSGSLLSGPVNKSTKTTTTSFVTVVNRSADDIAAILYTSGTTGRSKGAMLSQENLLSNSRSLVDHWKFDCHDVLLHALPIFHTHGLFVACNTILLAGGAMIFLPVFSAEMVIDALPQATTMMGVPTFYTRLLDQPLFTRQLTQHMRLFISGSAPLLSETHSQFEQRTGHRILERYGMTETNMITSNPYNGERKPGSVGFPLAGIECRVTDPDSGTVVVQGEIGVLELKGPNVFPGYWRMPEKTAEEFRDGYFVTGDLVNVDVQGYISIVGRCKDLIISGGYNVYPKEIEVILDEQDGVLESAVIGVPHADFGEAVIGVLVAESKRELDTDLIQRDIGEHLARYKQPKILLVVEELPRNAMSKVQKKVLRDQFVNVFS